MAKDTILHTWLDYVKELYNVEGLMLNTTMKDHQV